MCSIPVELLKAKTTGIVVVDFMYSILQHLPCFFCSTATKQGEQQTLRQKDLISSLTLTTSIFGVHLDRMLEGFYLELRVDMQKLGQPCMHTHVQGLSTQVNADQHQNPLCEITRNECD